MSRTGGRPKRQDPGSLPKLVFRPDEKKALRVARTRRVLLWVTLVLLAVVLLLVLTYRPRVGRVVPDEGRRMAEEAPAPGSLGPGQGIGVPPAAAAEAVAAQPVEAVVQSARAIEQASRLVLERWRRVGGQLPEEAGTREQAQALLEQFGSVLTAMDSSVRDLARAQAQADTVRLTSRKLDASAAYRASAVYAAAERHLRLLAQELEDQQAQVAAVQEATTAAAAGDANEAEVKMNVAVGIGRRAESRGKLLDESISQLRQAVQVLADR